MSERGKFLEIRRHVADSIGSVFGAIAIANWDYIEDSNVCESPIEIAFLIALAMRIDASKSSHIFYITDDAKDISEKKSICVSPQAKVLTYRADFLIILSNGQGTQEQLVIECDGHEFHERTKEQASRDKQRDRDLQAAGYRVFRFSGSDIYSNAWGCASETYKYIEARMKEW